MKNVVDLPGDPPQTYAVSGDVAPTRGQLQAYDASDDDGPKLGMTAGALGDVAVDALDPTVVSGSGQYWASVDVTAGADPGDFLAVGVTVFDNGAADPPALSSTQVHKLLFTYEVVDGQVSVSPMVGGSQALNVCQASPSSANLTPDWKLS